MAHDAAATPPRDSTPSPPSAAASSANSPSAALNPPALSTWARGEPRVVAHTRILDVQAVPFHHPRRDTRREFTVVSAPDWVNVLAHTADDQLVLVKQFRFGINAFSWEIPGGVIDSGEDPVAAGLRELREETGYEGVNARLLASVHPNPAFMNNRCHLVLVEQCRRSVAQAWDPDEELEVAAVPVREVYDRARAGGITHSLVLDALLFFEPLWRAKLGAH